MSRVDFITNILHYGMIELWLLVITEERVSAILTWALILQLIDTIYEYIMHE